MKTLLCWVVMGMVGMMAGQEVKEFDGTGWSFCAVRINLKQRVLEGTGTCDRKQFHESWEPLIVPKMPVDDITLNGGANCDHKITFGKSSKLIKDIFPEECGFPVSGPITLYNTVPIPEPSDVPAVNICDQNVEGWQICPFPSDFPKHSGWHYSCKQKTRILQHDEQTPPRYYCHKPETK